MDALQEFNQVMSRIYKAEKYMDEPFNKGLTGKDLEDAVQERGKCVEGLLKLLAKGKKLEGMIL